MKRRKEQISEPAAIDSAHFTVLDERLSLDQRSTDNGNGNELKLFFGAKSPLAALRRRPDGQDLFSSVVGVMARS
ncbi:Hypothetical protein NTJ_06365 [Nesidiocoris tenuis]|uniref:Uncharacterized protein n=1 Tax=Nesidiocoris tenuis TaxID=355587 RepID=A0ABN7ARN2_9HEMI|nr:Hypothetical protein NTJ_06365 [Nesidiocoris tenuis]